MSYLNCKSNIELPVHDKGRRCEIIEPQYRLELLVDKQEGNDDVNEYYLNNNRVDLSNFFQFYIECEKHRVKLPLKLRNRTKPIIYADNSISNKSMDSIKSMLYVAGFDTLFRAEINLAIEEKDSFSVCFTPMELFSVNGEIIIEESYSNYLCNEEVIRKVYEKMQYLTIVEISEYLASINHSCQLENSVEELSLEALENITLLYPEIILQLISKNASLDRYEILRKYQQLRTKSSDKLRLCEAFMGITDSDYDKIVWQKNLVESLRCDE